MEKNSDYVERELSEPGAKNAKSIAQEENARKRRLGIPLAQGVLARPIGPAMRVLA